jgi:hypothetical protein
MHPVLMHEIGKEATREGKIHCFIYTHECSKDTDGATGAFSWVIVGSVNFLIIITRKFRH